MKAKDFPYQSWSYNFQKRLNAGEPAHPVHVGTAKGGFAVVASEADVDHVDGGWGTVYVCVATTPFKKSNDTVLQTGESFRVGELELWNLCDCFPDFVDVVSVFRKHILISKSDVSQKCI